MLQPSAVVASAVVFGASEANLNGWEKKRSFWLRKFSGRGTVLFYPGGKLAVRGAKSVEDARRVLLEAADHIGVTIDEPIVHNVVFQGTLSAPVNLEELVVVLEDATYEPEIFPGLIFKTGHGSETVLVFSSGKAIVTGLRTQAEAERVWKEFLKAIAFV